jgi:lantibiotic modifying enzyme
MSAVTRREMLRLGICSGAGVAVFPHVVIAEWSRAMSRGRSDRPYLDAALRAERWIRSTAIDTPRGRTWPATPGEDGRGAPATTLYSGAPGVVLFYLELHACTGEQRFLDEAVRGALDIAEAIPPANAPVTQAGLYEGLAGHMFVLQATHRASGRDDLRAAAARAAGALALAARPGPRGTVSWNDTTDIISGSAGIGLALLSARDLLGDRALELARATADGLNELSKPLPGGQRKWMMDPTFPREMPNFSHGTAGVAYFLATLSQQGGDHRHFATALEGARYLRAISVASGDGTVIRHHDGDGSQLFYLGWCHGGAGTSRLWERLFSIDRDAQWRAAEEDAARGIIAQGVPERRTEGFWNNVSQCCGNAGVAEYFISRYRRSRRADDLAYARRHADDLLRRGSIDGDAERWPQAENRVSPAAIAAQTGWMQGAAGAGAMLLHLDAAVRGDIPRQAVVFPDAIAEPVSPG